MIRPFLFSFVLLFVTCRPPINHSSNNKQEEKDSLHYQTTNASDSVRDGIFRAFHTNGALKMEGYMQNGKRTGNWRAFYPDGTLWSEGTFKNGKRDKSTWVYHPNGVLKIKGSYTNGLKTGKWYFYNQEGEVIDSTYFSEPKSSKQ